VAYMSGGVAHLSATIPSNSQGRAMRTAEQIKAAHDVAKKLDESAKAIEKLERSLSDKPSHSVNIKLKSDLRKQAVILRSKFFYGD
jgi:hypothetical protein